MQTAKEKKSLIKDFIPESHQFKKNKIIYINGKIHRTKLQTLQKRKN